MTDILVDSNVILDVLTEDPQWFDWSSQMLTEYANRENLVINPIIYAEISIG
ncbi:DNA-binding protein, partial [Brasilonema octagenarum UFV-OR1]|nr:DNA-binding protein [Brasilonema octagenarum UFV-OR1]